VKDGAMKSCVAIVAIVSVYGIYSFTHSEADGLLFGSIAALIAGLAGYTAGTFKKVA
jgi:hypothetical protein